jgi:hypothetical protein
MSLQQPLVAPAEDPVEGKRWVVLLVFSWIEFNQVRTAMHAAIALLSPLFLSRTRALLLLLLLPPPPPPPPPPLLLLLLLLLLLRCVARTRPWYGSRSLPPRRRRPTPTARR